MLKMLRNTLVGLSIVLMAVAVSAATITIDGDLSDWTAAMQVDVAPGSEEGTGDLVGDPPAPVPAVIDIRDVYMTNDADFIYIRVDINEDGELSTIADANGIPEFFIDLDMSAETGQTWGYMLTGFEVWVDQPLTSQDSLLISADNGATYSKFECATVSAINGDDNGYEISISRAGLGLMDAPGFTIIVMTENTTDWSNDHFPDDLGGTKMDYYFSDTKVIDGLMDDWHAWDQMDVGDLLEETGDFAEYPGLDIKDVYMAYDDEMIYVRVDLNEDYVYSDAEAIPGVVQFFFDTDLTDTTGLTWGGWAMGADYWMHPLNATDTVLKYMGVGNSDENYDMVGLGYDVAFNGDDNIYECAIPRADVGEVGTFYESLYFLAMNEYADGEWPNDEFPNTNGDGEAVALFAFGSGGTMRMHPVAIDEPAVSIPSEFAIIGNYPNPFNPSTTIRFSLNQATNVTLDIYNMLGQKVATVYNGMGQTGTNEVLWNGTNDFDQSVDSGVYLYRVATPTGAVSGKMIMLK